MRLGRTKAFLVLTLLAGGLVSQLPSALGDDSAYSLSALWDAIFDLQSKDKDLQAQIDELKAERNALIAAQNGEHKLTSDVYAVVRSEAAGDRTLVYITAGNNGPDRAAGVKLTIFYLMPLFEINSINGKLCEDRSRGIIECTLGTVDPDQESLVIVDTTARESGKPNTWTVDVSSTAEDADYTNNHVTHGFETGSGRPIEVQIVEQNGEATESKVESEQDNTNSNSTTTEAEHVENSENQAASSGPNEQDDPSSNSTQYSNDTSSQDEMESTSEETNDNSVPGGAEKQQGQSNENESNSEDTSGQTAEAQSNEGESEKSTSNGSNEGEGTSQ